MSTEKQKTSVSLERKILRRLKKEARRQRRSVSSLVEIWIDQELPKNEEKPAVATTS